MWHARISEGDTRREEQEGEDEERAADRCAHVCEEGAQRRATSNRLHTLKKSGFQLILQTCLSRGCYIYLDINMSCSPAPSGRGVMLEPV